MTLVPVRYGMWWPLGIQGGVIVGNPSVMVMDAAGEKAAFIGRLFLNSGASKTLSAAGGGSILFRTASITFANGSTTLDIGLQDVATGAGPPAQPDGTFDVKRTLTGGTDTLTANTYFTVSMTGGTGSKTLSHGDLFAVVFDMTARGGADSVQVRGGAVGQSGAAFGGSMPTASQYLGSWAIHASHPNIIILFDDGTIGWIDFGMPVSAGASTQWTNATSPDENGLLFQLPFDCSIDALGLMQAAWAAADGDGTLALYSDPLGTPSSLASVAILGEQMPVSLPGMFWGLLASEVSLSKATNYCLALKATSTGNVGLGTVTLGNEAHRVYFPGGTTIAKASRNDGSGAFSAESPAISIYQMGVRISQIHDGAGSGGGLLVHPGMAGGCRG